MFTLWLQNFDQIYYYIISLELMFNLGCGILSDKWNDQFYSCFILGIPTPDGHSRLAYVSIIKERWHILPS